MYTRITKSGGRQYLQLVESFRNDSGKVRTRVVANLSRDSLVDQRILFPLEVQGLDGGVDGLVEEVCVCEGLMGKKVGLEVSPDGFDIVEFGRVFGQPLDAQPMGARGQRGLGRLAGMDRAVVEDDYDGPLALTGLGAVEMVKFF